MFSLTPFSEDTIRRHLARQAREPFSYREVGVSNRSTRSSGYTVDHNRALLGHGASTFERACAALAHWEMFDLGWVRLCWPSAPIEVGSTVGVLVRALGGWWLNACRIVYTLNENGDVNRFGFAYGTLPDHAESGEERFTIEWHRRDDSVWYDLLAFSRPRSALARVGGIYVRQLQRRFASDSLQAMVRAAAATARRPPPE